ncbi:S8 family serine peptidase [Actinoplanes sp. NPDC051470]|uniref:S8 family peptidase n=1 Tax=Actinoplanes sp. NPDC051470 TaxID=3157224 RepID=UPI0034322835
MKSAGTILAAALAVSVALGASPAAAAEPETPARRPAPAGRTAVTLLTGDTVTVSDAHGGRAIGGGLSIARGPGRDHVRFLVESRRGHTFVLPTDAQPLVASGRMDERLFDVTGLIAMGYDDRRRATLPLIVTGATATTGRSLPAVGGRAVTVPRNGTAWAALTIGDPRSRRTTGKVWLDGIRKPTLDRSTAQIGAPAAWQAGLTGAGVTVAVLDTGVDTTHPDLAGKVTTAVSFTDNPATTDEFGHGTHVASIIAGTGAASGGRFKGVAPDARIVSGKVCEPQGCTESAILAGMQWAAAEVRAPIVNLSLGGPDSVGVDPLEAAVNTLTAQYGTLFVIAAGNEGKDAPVASPASADAALAVGAVDRDGQLADFSQPGPRLGDHALKPDVTAPGVGIVAAKAAGTELGEPVGDAYVTLSGTSMATPHVAGAAVLLRQQHPAWGADFLKPALMGTARRNPAQTTFQQGAGLIDVAAAITQPVSADLPSLSFGEQRWPHTDDPVLTRTVTYRNAGPTAVTLPVSISGSGLFRAGATSVTVPASGTAGVTVTVDTRAPGADGTAEAWLVAGGVTTPMVVLKEAESYDLTLRHIDRDGSAASLYETAVVGARSDFYRRAYDASGTVTLRVPKGRYLMYSVVGTPYGDEFERHTALFTRPRLDLTRDTTITLDARTAGTFALSIPERSAELIQIDVSAYQDTDAGPVWLSLYGYAAKDVATRHLGAADPRFLASVTHIWARPDGEGWYNNSPYLYTLAEAREGRMFDGFTRTYRKRDLATVRNDLRAEPSGVATGRWIAPIFGDNDRALQLIMPVAPSGVRTDYVNGGPGLRWHSGVIYQAGAWDTTHEYRDGPHTWRPGRTYTDVWNAGPIGPAFPPRTSGEPWVRRTGDRLVAELPLFSDRAGHPGQTSLFESTRTALYRDGTLVDTWAGPNAGFDLPARPATYRLETRATRATSDLSTEISAAWTFRSAPSLKTRALPVTAVRFAPALDASDAARGGRAVIPVRLDRQPGSAGVARRVAVDVSYDDGRTWRAASTVGLDDHWVTTLRQPATGYVSLRAKVTDLDGSTTTQTIIRAYRLTR